MTDAKLYASEGLAVSTFQSLTCGVPQGTKMGPLCFLMLINDALRETPARWKYVDDSTIGISFNNSAPNYTALQDLLNSLQNWATNNHVTINHTKTMVMHINLSSDIVPPPSITLGPNTLQVVDSTKLLGVTIDNKLNY